MPNVEFSPDAQKYAFLVSGQYGPGMAHEAGCEVIEYQFPAEETPPWDTKGKEKAEDFAHLRIRVNSDEFGSVVIRHWEPIKAFSGSKLSDWLVSLGVPVEGETFRHDTDQVPGRKCGIEVGDARQGNDGRWWTGKLLNVMGR